MYYHSHPAADIFPRMAPDDFEQFKANISANGVREPIWICNGMVLDGRHRMRACNELGIEAAFREYAGDDPAGFVVSLNLHRRHLDTSQRAMVAAKLATLKQGRPEETGQLASITQPEAAALLNVGERSVRRAREVLDEGTPELIEAVEQGEIAVSAAAEIAALPKKEQSKAMAHVGRRTGQNEWYTPPQIIEAARKVMGGIDLDPASCEAADLIVKAEKHYTAEDDGLAQEWGGNVWLNPPYAQPLIAKFAEAVTAKFISGEIKQACVLINNARETGWFQRMAEEASAICILCGRVKFIDKHGNPGAPLQGQVILYFGHNIEAFAGEFCWKGAIYGASLSSRRGR